MAIWFYNRPLDKADPTELKVAQMLDDQLSDDWRIRWGYFYERKSSVGLRDKEGDFILLGPDGRILVLEVKGGRNRHFALTGEWEHGEDNPAVQLHEEWQAVIDDLNEHYDKKVPYVGKALRYTLPIFQYLKSLRANGTAQLVDCIEAHEHLPTGMDITKSAATKEQTKEAVEAIVSNWKSKGLCRPTDVAVI